MVIEGKPIVCVDELKYLIIRLLRTKPHHLR